MRRRFGAWLLALAAANAGAQARAGRHEQRCEGMAAVVETSHPHTVAAACDGARDALGFLRGRWFGVPVSPRLWRAVAAHALAAMPGRERFLREVLVGAIVPDLSP